MNHPPGAGRADLTPPRSARLGVSGHPVPTGSPDPAKVTGMTKPRRNLQNLLTAAVGLIATAVQAQGMWNFFGDQFHITNPWLRAGMFAFIELAILASALRARRHRIDTGKVGFDGVAVWVLAVISGILSATDAHTTGAILGRLIVPLIAAWMFERAISVERSDKVGVLDGIPWRLTPERVLVWLRLADPTDRTVADVARTHRLSQLARMAYRLDQTPASKVRKRARLERQVTRRLLKVNAELRLATNPIVMAELRLNLATLFQALGQMTPGAVSDLSPWGVNNTPDGTVEGSDTPAVPVVFRDPPRHPDTPRYRLPIIPAKPPAGTVGDTPAEPLATPQAAPFTAPWVAPVPEPLVRIIDTPVDTPNGTLRAVPEPHGNGTGTGTPDTAVTSGDTPDGTVVEFPADAVLLKVLRNPRRVPREADGTVPIKRAMSTLGVGRNRALRLLRAEGLLRDSGTAEGSDNGSARGSADTPDDDPERPRVPTNGHNPIHLIGASA